MSEEYKALRAEMLQWQNRRFTVLTASVAVTIGILGFDGVLKGEAAVGWRLVTTLLWFFLGAAAALIWYAGRANAKAGAYIVVFHEDTDRGWETRLMALKEERLDWLHLNRIIVLIYVALAALSALAPWAARAGQSSGPCPMAALIFSGVWAGAIFLLLLCETPKATYVRHFREMKAREDAAKPPLAPGAAGGA
jgi:hypothetical protein